MHPSTRPPMPGPSSMPSTATEEGTGTQKRCIVPRPTAHQLGKSAHAWGRIRQVQQNTNQRSRQTFWDTVQPVGKVRRMQTRPWRGHKTTVLNPSGRKARVVAGSHNQRAVQSSTRTIRLCAANQRYPCKPVKNQNKGRQVCTGQAVRVENLLVPKSP